MISSSPTRRGINIFAAEGAPVVAVNDGVIVKMGNSKKLGRYVVLRDAYGNRYTYAKLGEIVREHRTVVMPTGKEKRVPVDSENIRPRLYALPGRVDERRAGAGRANGSTTPAAIGADGTLKVGSRVIAGTVLARIGAGEDGIDPHINFSIRPAGRGAPRIDPKPILDGWKLLEATAIYRAKGKNPFAAKLSGAGVLLLSKEALQRRVLADERTRSLRPATAPTSAPGQIDRRVLATLEYLAEQGFRPDDHLAAVRPRHHHDQRQRLQPLLRQRGRHRGDQRRPGPRPPGPRLDHRRRCSRRCCACRGRWSPRS